MRASSTMAMAIAAMVATAGLPVADGVSADTARTPPYYASIAASRARMRSGPARAYPATWLYRRADLPVRVVAVRKEWRRIEDPAGTQGWMLAALISGTRTAIVPAGEIELRERPVPGAKVVWRAARGVVGRIGRCVDGWCRFDVRGRAGFVEAARLWGVGAGEVLP